mmetsp:Transcript_12151/g.15416  ORF Transcript_12151/g.15416 Transcript_12151/m.15416 type:complete len:115 (+) Transcript_12151:185-529(+)
MDATITLAPIIIQDVSALNLPMPTITPSPTNNGPFMNCISDVIKAGNFIASRTSGIVVNMGVMNGKMIIWAVPKPIPTIDPQINNLSAIILAASTPLDTFSDGTSAAAEAFIPT